jgi:hypothetical protein
LPAAADSISETNRPTALNPAPHRPALIWRDSYDSRFDPKSSCI